MNQQHTKWVELVHRGYSSIAIFFDGQWGGEFNYPVRRFSHAFFGNTKAEAEKKFQAGVDFYLSQITQIPHHRPERQGMAGVLELMEFERIAADFELKLLIWPELPPQLKAEVATLMKSARRPIAYNQAALDELGLFALNQPTRIELSQWAQATWILGELERTQAGLAVARVRSNLVKENQHV